MDFPLQKRDSKSDRIDIPLDLTWRTKRRQDSFLEVTGWLEFFVDGLATQLHEVSERGKRVMKADVIARQHELNDRQTKALRFLLDHAEMHIRDLAALCSGVNRRTLQRDLQQMEDLGLVVRKGAARQSLYAFGGKGL